MAVVVHTFTNTKWQLLAEPTERITVVNPSGISVYMCHTELNAPPTAGDFNIMEVGGFIGTYDGPANTYIWGKADRVNAFIRIRPYGTVDPEQDIQHLGQAINEVRAIVTGHMNDVANPHTVTKAQVGLGKLPNAKSDSVTETSSNILATSKAVSTVNDSILAHTSNKSNPHGVTKAQIGLGKVQNYAMTTETGAINTSDWASYMSPAATAVAIAQLAEVAYTVSPQTVVEGQVANRPTGWNFSECSPPTKLVELISGKQVRVNSGLKVAFACDQKARLSNLLQTAITFNLPPEQATIYYIYVNLLRNGNINSAGATYIPPQTGEKKEGSLSDYFSTATCTMYDETNNPIQRVYIAKAFMTGQTVSSIVSVPFGGVHVLPVPSTLGQNQRYLVSNPYIEPVNVATEVYYNSTWGDPGWNDQIGVKGNIYPSEPMDKLVVQTGLMGVLTAGQESGSAFGSAFTTVTSPIRVRLTVSKRYT
jgi:hypothetical protein